MQGNFWIFTLSLVSTIVNTKRALRSFVYMELYQRQENEVSFEIYQTHLIAWQATQEHGPLTH